MPRFVRAFTRPQGRRVGEQALCYVRAHIRRANRSMRSWQRTHVYASGRACSRAGEIPSAHSTHTPYSPSFSRSRAAERRFTRSTSLSRVAKLISRFSLAWISSTSSAQGELSPIAPG